MWEIDALLKSSIAFIKDSKLDVESKKQMIWNFENIPELYEFDAGNFEKSEVDSNIDYKEINPYELGRLIIDEAKSKNRIDLIYKWSAFLLNFWSEYFSNIDTLENLKLNYLKPIKVIFTECDFVDYKPIHATLTIYKNGNKWFSEEQNNLIKWYCN